MNNKENKKQFQIKPPKLSKIFSVFQYLNKNIKLPNKLHVKIKNLPILGKINTSIYISVFPLILIFIISIVIVYFTIIQGSIKKDLETKSENALQAYYFYRHQAMVYSRMIASLKGIILESIVENPNRGKIKKIIRDQILNLQVSRIGVFSKSGELLNSVRNKNITPAFKFKPEKEGIFDERVKTKKGKEDKYHYILNATSEIHFEGEKTGFITVSYNFTQLIAQQIKELSGGNIFFVLDNKLIATSLGNLKNKEPFLFPDVSEVDNETIFTASAHLTFPDSKVEIISYDMKFINLTDELISKDTNFRIAVGENNFQYQLILILIFSGVILVSFFLIVFSLILSFRIASGIGYATSRISLAIEDIAKGNFSKRLKVQSQDELGSIAGRINDMAGKLQELEETRTRKAILQKEMEIAHNLQKAVLPEDQAMDYYNFCGFMKPADEVGGDYYDFKKIIWENQDYYWFMIGDVSGHGLEAGLIMLMGQTAFRNSLDLQPGLGPKNIFSVVNKTLQSNIDKLKSRKYMTGSVLRADINGNFISAGLHLDMLIFRKSEKKVARLPSQGMWLGILPDIEKSTDEIHFKLEKGDVLLLYTDGLTEAMNSKHELYDDLRLIKVLEGNGYSKIEDIRNSILEDLNQFTEGQKQMDDISFILIQMK
jgi:serine phosphatase RsbU (regulator of sigma subunit)